MDLIYRYDPHQPIVLDAPQTALAAQRVLADGNRRLTSVVAQMQKATLGEDAASEIVVPVCPLSMGIPLWAGAVPTQQPFAAVLGCADARVPVEAIFDQSFNDLFVLRIAGNVLGTECLGSLDFAARQFARSLKLVMVLGHTGCGAVSAAVDTYLSPQDYAGIAFTHSLRSIVDRIMIAVRGASTALQQVCGPSVRRDPNYKDALKELTVYLNAAITAFELRREVSALQAESIQVVYSVYDLATMFVTAMPTEKPVEPSFGPAPAQDQLTELANRLAAAIVEKGMLESSVPG
ncbi:MAG: carbonic anhydrase [Planctomycetaceae bacterium]